MSAGEISAHRKFCVHTDFKKLEGTLAPGHAEVNPIQNISPQRQTGK